MVMADILKRWQVLLGDSDAQLLTGTDEHGMKVRRIYAVHICIRSWVIH
jgi:methionyl-tRNA synthetase